MSEKRPKGWGVKAAQISKWLATEKVGGGERMKVRGEEGGMEDT